MLISIFVRRFFGRVERNITVLLGIVELDHSIIGGETKKNGTFLQHHHLRGGIDVRYRLELINTNT